MATYYVEPGETSVDVAAATNSGTPCGLNAAWDDMCAGTNIGTGDTIQLGDGTYDDTTYDVPAAGLGDCSQNIDLTIQSENTDPTLCIVDFSGNTAGVDGFHITTTGTWVFNGLTIHGQKSTTEANITFTDGTLYLRNCIIYGGSRNGVVKVSTAAAASIYLYNCEVYGVALDGVSTQGAGGAAANRIIEAHYCYFHDITTAAAVQGMTMHGGGICRAYFCKFENIGTGDPKTSGSAIGHDSDSNNHTYVYNCVIDDCYVGLHSSGVLVAKNCYIKDATHNSITTSIDGAETIVDDCIIVNSGNYSISANRVGDLTVRRSIILHTSSAGYVILGELGGDNDITLTLEDNVIYSNESTAKFLVRFAGRTWNIKRNLIWINHNAYSQDSHCTMGVTQTTPVITFEHNCLRTLGTDYIFYTVGIATTYNGGYNTWGSGTQLERLADMGTQTGKATDQQGTITWRGFSRELMLSPGALHYRDYGVPMMSGWYRPKGSMNMGTFCRRPIK